MIRQEGLSRTARIVAITAHSLPEDRERFRAAGMDDHLIKPISQAALVRVIEGPAHELRPGLQEDSLILAERMAELSASLGAAGMVRIIGQFRRDIPLALDRLQLAAQHGQTASVAQAAHEATGACAMIGAAALGKKLAQIEAACRENDLTAALALVPLLAPLWRATADALPGEPES